MEKISKKKMLDLFSSVEFIQYLWSSMTLQDINTMDKRIDNWDWWFISRRKIQKSSTNQIVFAYTDERVNYKEGLYWHGNLSYMNFSRGDEFYMHGDFILIQSKNAYATIIYRLDK